MVIPLILEDALSPKLSSAEPAEVFSGTPEAAALLLRDVVQLRASQEGPVQVATAESLTGGDVGGAICTVPGASAYYRGGVISYAYEVKAQVLGVDAQLLAREGAVHPAVAVQMAVGAARVCGADYAVSTTGVAGPVLRMASRWVRSISVCAPRAVLRCLSATIRGIARRFVRRRARMRLPCWRVRCAAVPVGF